MTNHVHLVAIPERPDSLARALGQSHSRYAQRSNRRYGRSGHLWQNRSDVVVDQGFTAIKVPQAAEALWWPDRIVSV